MFFRMMARRFIGVPIRTGIMTTGDVGTVGRLFVILSVMLLCGLFVVLNRPLVVLGGLAVRFRSILRHERLPFEEWPHGHAADIRRGIPAETRPHRPSRAFIEPGSPAVLRHCI
jgi:hypothetical protein